MEDGVDGNVEDSAENRVRGQMGKVLGGEGGMLSLGVILLIFNEFQLQKPKLGRVTFVLPFYYFYLHVQICP